MYANRVKDWYVEVEEYTNNDPVESCQQSFDFLNKADYVKKSIEQMVIRYKGDACRIANR